MALWHEIDLTTDTDVHLVLGYSCAFHRNGKGYLSGGSGLHGPDDVEEESLFSDYEELELSDCKVSIVDGSATIIYQSGMFNMLDIGLYVTPDQEGRPFPQRRRCRKPERRALYMVCW